MISDTDCLNGLIATRQWGELQNLKPQFDLLKLFDDAIVENSWSRILAYLFRSDESHKLGCELFKAWLNAIEKESKQTLSISFSKSTKTYAQTERSTDEQRRIDILVTLKDESETTVGVFGIENKINAGEQPDQLADYQHWIIEKYPKVDKRFLFFLTPDGRLPETADKNSKCTVLPCSYKTVCSACKFVLQSAEPHVGILLKAMIDHLEGEAIVEKKAAAFIAELFLKEEHRRALALICSHCPNYASVLEQIKEQIEEHKAVYSLLPDKPIPDVRIYNRKFFEIYFEEIERPFKDVWLAFCLSKLDDPQHLPPSIGDKIAFRVIAWYYNSANERAESFKSKVEAKLPQSSDDYSTRCDYTDKYVIVWEGGNYKLRDLGSADVKELIKLLENGLTSTYQPLHKAITGLKKK